MKKASIQYEQFYAWLQIYPQERIQPDSLVDEYCKAQEGLDGRTQHHVIWVILFERLLHAHALYMPKQSVRKEHALLFCQIAHESLNDFLEEGHRRSAVFRAK